MGSGLQHRRPAAPAADEPGRRPLCEALHGTRELNTATRDTARLPTGRRIRVLRIARVALHLAAGALAVGLVFPFAAGDTRRRFRQRWSRRLLAKLGVGLDPRGAAIEPGCLLVANHISWLDIFVVNALTPAAFVSKAEVRGWPVFGWLAAANDTVFLRRGSRGHAKIINAEIGSLLAAGRNVAVFPEGTTTDGSHVLHFHAALLQPAIECGHPVQPLAISYQGADGRRSRAPAYDGDVTLGQSLAAIIAEPRLVARIEVAAPLPATAGTDRKALAQTARGAIVASLARAYP